ncbi:MAG: hypothetical protein PHS64_05375 [Candidatus Omnitrophica bacterium]|nr:hypothetical protein [Candidatus Omnitrophota bacterium]
MSEKEFWGFLHAMLGRGRMNMWMGRIDSNDPRLNEAERFISSHALLPIGCENISRSDILRMGTLLFQPRTLRQTKEAVLIILAHHPSQEALAVLEKFNACPDRELRVFAELALDECCMWNDEAKVN